jgi:hypothetical protein
VLLTVLLACPERNVDDEAAALRGHGLRHQATGGVASGEIPVFDDVLVLATYAIHENIQAALFSDDAAQQCVNLLITAIDVYSSGRFA